MKEELFDISCLFGYVEPKQFRKFENGRMVTYHYSITYDDNGKEISRTDPVSFGSIGWDNGTPFTEVDYNRLKGGVMDNERYNYLYHKCINPKQSLRSKIIDISVILLFVLMVSWGLM
jgi:hypothetical protein